MKLLTFISVIIFTLFTNKQELNTLTNTDWNLIKVETRKTNQIQFAVPACETTLHFDSNGHYNGYSGWNSFNGNYSTMDGNKITMNNPVRTERAGPQNCKLGEMLYDHYPKTKTYLIQADTLVIWTVDSVKIVFQKK